MTNLYTVFGVDSLTTLSVRPHHHNAEPNLGDIVFVQEEPVAKAEATTNESIMGGDGWTVYLDRPVAGILIGTLIGIGTP